MGLANDIKPLRILIASASSSSSLDILDETSLSSSEEELCKIESTSKSSGDDNEGLGILNEGVLTTPHDENLFAWPFLPLLLFVLKFVFRHRLVRGVRCGVDDEEDDISDILQ